MKVLPWFALLFACTAVPADAHLTFAGTPKTDLFSSARLIDTNQSQSLEAIPLTEQNNSLSSYKLAGVHFIVDATKKQQVWGSSGLDNEFTDPTGDNCKRLGFAITSCASGLFNRACPYNDKIYDKCCDASYHFTASQCTSPRKLSTDTCGGKYSCLCSTSTYPFASCNDPQIKGSSCTDDKGTRYATCVCPNSVSTPYGCETYYAAPCGSVCKKAYADNCRNRTAVQTPYGCQTYFSDCSSKCQKAYADNCRNRTAVSAPYGCQQAYSDCQSKCEVAYADNCRNRTAVQTPYGCQTYFSDCSSKCQKAYADNCRNRTAAIASCPANATCSYFADCASKIQSWSCKSGYVKSGNSCIVENPCPGYEKKSSCPNKYYTKEVCSKDSSYIKCTATCGSRIVDDNSSYKIDESNSGGVVVITKDGTYLPSGATVYSNVNFPQYSECAALSKPTITLTTSNGYAASIGISRIENINFIVNFNPWVQPDICSVAYGYANNSFCDYSCDTNNCMCVNGCRYNSSCQYDASCTSYIEAQSSVAGDLCDIANNYDGYCTNTNSPSVGVKLDPATKIRSETYTNNGKSSTRTYYEGTLKNVNIIVNGNPQIAAQIGGGAHIDKTVKFEGSNSISGGSRYSVWARGHNTYAYGIVRGVLQVNSGATLSLGKAACIYNQWNGAVVRNGTISGTVTQNCSTYTLKW